MLTVMRIYNSVKTKKTDSKRLELFFREFHLTKGIIQQFLASQNSLGLVLYSQSVHRRVYTYSNDQYKLVASSKRQFLNLVENRSERNFI